MSYSKYPLIPYHQQTSQVAQCLKSLQANAGDIKDMVSLPGSGRSPARGHGNSLQYFAWNILWTEELGRNSPWGHKESDMTETT